MHTFNPILYHTMDEFHDEQVIKLYSAFAIANLVDSITFDGPYYKFGWRFSSFISMYLYDDSNNFMVHVAMYWTAIW